MDWVFNVPIKFMEYSLEEFKNRLNIFENVLLIASKRVIKTFEINTDSLDVIDKSIANPDVQLVENVLSDLNKPELIIAIGGGSTIDLAKAIFALYEYKNEDVLNSIKNKTYLDNNDFILIIAVPTTAGTGSECTKWATIWDMNNLKKIFSGCRILISKGILDSSRTNFHNG